MRSAFGSLDAVPPAWRALLEEVGDALTHAEQERERMRLAMERTGTELRELLVELDALRRARVTAESTNLVRGEILATVGRTMRTPADAILGLTGLLRTGALLPTQRAYVDAVHSAVEDPGPAIPGDLRPTLFEPFGRGDVYSPRQGALGLPISRQLVHLMGGTLGVENVAEMSGGTRFTLELPLAAVEETAGAGEASQQAELALTPGASPRLVVVESDDHQRASWTAIAHAAGFEPARCARGGGGIGVLRRGPAAG